MVFSLPQPCLASGRPIAAGLAPWRRGFWLALLGVSLAGRVQAQSSAFPEFTVPTARDYLETVAKSVQTQAGHEAEWCFLQARLMSQLGKQDEAERLARQSADRDPNRADAHSFLADLFIRQDRMEDALGQLRRMLELNPKTPGGQRRLGMVLDRLGDREGARKAFESGIQLAPDDATARLLLGRLLLDLGQVKEASSQLEQAFQLDPQSANALYALFEAQNRLGNRDTARKTLSLFQELKRMEKAALDADNAAYDNDKAMRAMAAGFHIDTAVLLLQQQKLDPAEAHLHQAIRINPQSLQAREWLAKVCLQNRNLTEARTTYEELVRLEPKQADYRANLGTLLLQLKDYPAATAELKRALELNPKQPEALNNLARHCLSAKNELPEALTLCRRLVQALPTAANYDLLGWALYANGQIEDARAAAAQAVQREPNNAMYRERYRRLQQAP